MALWTPAQLPSELWIDFSDTSTLFDATTGGSNVTNGVGIARAEDKSGNGRNFTQGTAGSRPSWTSGVQNSLGIARHDGGDWLTSVDASSVWNFLHSGDSTVFVVNKNGTSANPVAAYAWLGTNGGSSGNRGVAFLYDDRNILTGLTDCFNCTISAGSGIISYSAVNIGNTYIETEFRDIITPNAFGLFSIKSDPTNATVGSRIKISVNGGSLVGNNTRTGGITASNATYTLQIGSLGNNGVPLVGDYCELLIFDSLLSDTDRQKVEGYLAWKWGLEANLPAGHPYENAAPTIQSPNTRRRRYAGGYGL